MKTFLFLFLFLLPLAAYANSLTQLSAQEQREVDNRLKTFYANPNDPGPMNRREPKYDLLEHRYVHPNAFLREEASNGNPLLELAGKKATPAFDRAYCEKVIKRHFPKLYLQSCQAGLNASAEGNDNIDDLTAGWIPRGQTVFHLDYIPTKGVTSLPIWADDYWRTKWGGISFRYSAYDEKKEFKTYQEAISSYTEPREWSSLKGVTAAELEKKILPLSPAEKYDLTVGDEGFALTNQQKALGSFSLTPEGDVESWMGICHGWTAASVMLPPPMRPTQVVGARGAKVTWYPEDVRALMSLHWANTTVRSNYIGGRCQQRKVQEYPNGRIADQDCFDTNPATFHLALGNMIGRNKLSFIMDKSFDYEVWNQPVIAYELTYFNPLDPNKKSTNWKEVAVEYNDEFKARDRFQHPLTRGIRGEGGYDDSGISKIVGVIANVVYVVETSPPSFGPQPDTNPLERAVYTYDLELHEVKGHLYPLGGEWFQNAHPDFLWIPRKDAFAATSFDYAKLDYTGSSAPTAQLADYAAQASNQGYPLCSVIKELVKRTSGVDAYKCPLASR